MLVTSEEVDQNAQLYWYYKGADIADGVFSSSQDRSSQPDGGGHEGDDMVGRAAPDGSGGWRVG